MSETGRESSAVAAGAALAAARKAHNLTVADAARQLKLSVHQIEALEAGGFDKLPGPIFVRGFIRNYARLLRLDPEEMLRTISPDIPSPPLPEGAPGSTEIPFPSARSQRWPRYAIAGLLLIGTVAVYEFYWIGHQFREVSPAPAAGVADTTSPPPITAVTPVAATAEPEQPAASAATTGALATAQGATTTGEPSPAAASEAAAGTSVPGDHERSPRPGEHQVLLAFDQASWVHIRDGSGRVIYSRLNQPGTEQRVYGAPPFSLVIGNAPGVRLTYDDSSVDLKQYTMKLNVARFTLK
jgi:cytoskeleton protein RodZ